MMDLSYGNPVLFSKTRFISLCKVDCHMTNFSHKRISCQESIVFIFRIKVDIKYMVMKLGKIKEKHVEYELLCT